MQYCAAGCRGADCSLAPPNAKLGTPASTIINPPRPADACPGKDGAIARALRPTVLLVKAMPKIRAFAAGGNGRGAGSFVFSAYGLAATGIGRVRAVGVRQWAFCCA